METKFSGTQQAEHTTEQPQAGRTRAAKQYNTRVVMAIVTITLAIGVALTALVVGVAGGTDTNAPPSPGVTRPYGNELPPKGLDQRLHEMAPDGSAVPPKGIDQHLYNLAEVAPGQQARSH